MCERGCDVLSRLLSSLAPQSLIVQEVQARWESECSFKAFSEWWNKHRHLLEAWSSPLDHPAQNSAEALVRIVLKPME
jgi:hypothetical protein